MKITKNNFEKNIFKNGSKTYFTSSLFFPKDKRLAVYKLYSFVRLADDFVDEIPQNKTAFLLLKNSYQKKASNVPIVSIKKVLQNIYDLQKEYKISNVEIKAFLCSMEMDLKKQKYITMEDTLRYIYGSAEVIGLMMSKIIGLNIESYKYAKYQGRAMQYINFIRDIDEDIKLGRCYFPYNIRLKYGLKSWNENIVTNNGFELFIKEQIEQYYTWQQKAEKGWKYIPYRSRVAVITASDGYNWTAKKIYNKPAIVFNKKVKPSKAILLVFACKNFIKAVFY